MINKAMIEIPPKFSGHPPVNPKSQWKNSTKDWKGAQGLAEDVRYYGEWMKQKAFEKIGHLYPKINNTHGQEYTVIAWIWTRTVKCPNPACGCEMPLASSFELSKKKGKEVFIQPLIVGKKICYKVKYGKNAPEPPKIARGKFKCVCCGEIATGEYVRSEFATKRSSARLMAIVAEGDRGRLYFSPNAIHENVAVCSMPEWKPEAEMNQECTDLVSGRGYGFSHWYQLFTNRQLTTLTTFSDLVVEVQAQIQADGGSKEYAQAVSVYLGFGIDKLAIYSNSLCPWLNQPKNEIVGNSFGRQALPMVWDYAEANPFSNGGGTLGQQLDYICKVITMCFSQVICGGFSVQAAAQSENGLRNIMVSTDPPYYDNIAYADLSDFFYVWMRQSLKSVYSELFCTMLVPKSEELVATTYRFDGNKEKACTFFENGMLNAFRQINNSVYVDIPTTVYYAYKQSENDGEKTTAFTGWETMLSALIQSGFAITGTWPMRTERDGRMIGNGTNALASSIVLVCRKRSTDTPICTRRDFISTLKHELKPALHKLQASNIAPVDLAQSAIGPGMGVYSRFSKVLEADGKPMSIRSALQIINHELDLYFTEQDGELDRDSRFCVDFYTQYAFNDMKFGDADVLARAKNTSTQKLEKCGVLYAQRGVARLLTRAEIPEKVDTSEKITWLLTQQLTRAMEKGGVIATAEIIADMFGSNAEYAKALAYRLFTIAERKGWTQEAYAYNSLVIAWPEVQSKAAELRSKRQNTKQVTLFDSVNKNKGRVK